MEIKVVEVTKEEKTNLFTFLLNRYKAECEDSPFGFDIEVDEVDEYIDFVKESISIQKFEIELDGVIKTIFNRISFIEEKIPESELVLEDGKSVVKSTGKISKSVSHSSTFYEFLNGEFTDITNDDIIHFGYLK
jgi:hypothetical protein